jgi:hypothetical protein
MKEQDIFTYVTGQEADYKQAVKMTDSWDWSMADHIKTTILYKNSQLLTGKSDDKPVRNVVLPILRLQYRSEGFDLKDIILFVNSAEEYFKSFLVKKFHTKWARAKGIDTFIDNLVETYVDFGGVLVKKVKSGPEVVPWQSVAFCDQTNFLSGPFGIRHYYSPDQLKDMESSGWGNKAKGATMTIDELIEASSDQKTLTRNDPQVNNTPGKYLEVYEIHGTLPESWLKEGGDPKKYVKQMQIIAFIKSRDGGKVGVTIYKGLERESSFRLLLREEIFGRALGLGGAEELFEAQVWTTYDQIRIKAMLDQASKVIFQTTDPGFAARNRTSDMDNGEILTLEDGKQITQVNTNPMNIALFERSTSEWDIHAKEIGSATGATTGVSPGSRTSFNALSLLTQQGLAIHDYRKGKIATFLGELYRDWFIPEIVTEITQGAEFLADLDLDELQYVSDALVTGAANDMIKEKILNGELVQEQEVKAFKAQVQASFRKGGTKKFIKILKGELKDAPIDVEVDIANKQKDLTAITKEIMPLFQQIIANPGVLQDPNNAKIFNMIIEYSGLDPIDFYQPPATEAPTAGGKITESINYKDLPPEAQSQLLAKVGITAKPAAPVESNA